MSYLIIEKRRSVRVNRGAQIGGVTLNLGLVKITDDRLSAIVPCLEPISKRIKNQKLHSLCTINYVI